MPNELKPFNLPPKLKPEVSEPEPVLLRLRLGVAGREAKRPIDPMFLKLSFRGS